MRSKEHLFDLTLGEAAKRKVRQMGRSARAAAKRWDDVGLSISLQTPRTGILARAGGFEPGFSPHGATSPLTAKDSSGISTPLRTSGGGECMRERADSTHP